MSFGGFGSFGGAPQQSASFSGFGAPAASTGFGAPQQTQTFGGFGQTQQQAPQQTQSLFGTGSQSGFGASTFGAPTAAASTGGFSLGGAFGAPQQQQQPTAFTGFGTQPDPNAQQQQQGAFTGFGQQPQQTQSSFGGFGQQPQQQQSTFGAPATQPFGSTFGTPQQPQATTSSFGFGASSTPSVGGGLFGGAAPTAFGAPASTGFGAPQTTQSGFGFGQQPQQQQTGAFGVSSFGGQQAQQVAPKGTRQVPFAPLIEDTTSKDPKTGAQLTVRSFYHSITCLGQYENKSFEELRCEDEELGGLSTFQGSQPAATTTGTGLFGTTSTGFGAAQPQQQTSGFAFGATQQPAATGAFGSTGFGQPAAATTGFGASTFGAPAASTGFGAGFGTAASQPATSSFGFGTTPAPAASTGFGFGTTAAPATTGFGTTPAATGGIFGSTGSGFDLGSSSTGFGAPAAAASSSGFGFGSTGGAFGSTPATGSSFSLGTTPAAAPAATTGFGFGAGFGAASTPAASTGFAFGATPAASSAASTGGFAFGATSSAPAATTSSFGSTGFGFGSTATSGFGASSSAASTGGLFGSTSTTTGFGTGTSGFGFGSTTAAAPTTTSGFGGFSLGGTTTPAPTTDTSATTGGLFGSTFGAPPVSQAATGTLVAKVDENNFLATFLNSSAQQISKTAVGLSQSQAMMGSSAIGSMGSTQFTSGGSSYMGGALVSHNPGTPLRSGMAALTHTPRSAARLRPRAFLPSPIGSGMRGQQLTLYGVGSPNASGSLTNTSMVSALGASFQGNTSATNTSVALTPELLVSRRNLRKLSHIPLPQIVDIGGGVTTTEEEKEQSEEKSFRLLAPPSANKNNTSTNLSRNNDRFASEEHDSVYPDLSRAPSDAPPSLSMRRDTSRLSSPASLYPPPRNANLTKDDRAALPTLNRSSYYTTPSMTELALMTREQLQAVPNFTVHHATMGSVSWEGLTDVTDLNLDELVLFEQDPKHGTCSVEVYPLGSHIPPVGEKLNKPAIITVKQCWPGGVVPSTDEAAEKKLAKYEKKLRTSTQKAGAEWIAYSPEKGTWAFKVQCFS